MRDLALVAGIVLIVGGVTLGGYAINQLRRSRPMRKQNR